MHSVGVNSLIFEEPVNSETYLNLRCVLYFCNCGSVEFYLSVVVCSTFFVIIKERY